MVKIMVKIMPGINEDINEDMMVAIINEQLNPKDLTAKYGYKRRKLLYMGVPLPEDLESIKKVTGDDSWQPDEWFVVPFRASDNLVSRSYKVWHDNVLQQMPSKLIGKNLIINHDWDDVRSSVGIIFDGFMSYDEPDQENYESDTVSQSNYKIIQEKGYKCVYLLAAIHASKPQEIMDIKTGRVSKCSTGSILSDVSIICPHCSEEYGREVSFFEIDENSNYICPHSIPGGYQVEEDELVADYAIWDGIFDGIELSLVVCGNLPGASVVR